MPPNEPRLDDGAQTNFIRATEPVGKTKQLIVWINGKPHDVTKFLPFHPGGSVIQQFHGKDATDAFAALHGEETFKKLRGFQVDESTVPKHLHPQQPSKVTLAYREFKKQLESEGWFKRSYAWYTYKTVTTQLILLLAVYCTVSSYTLAGSILLGIYWQQMGWIAHEYGHHQVFKGRKPNNVATLIQGNFLQGFSSTWWKDRHNSHHAVTNTLDGDPDVDNMPLFVWDVSDLQRVNSPTLKKTLPYQAYYFLPWTPSLRAIWELQSAMFVHSMKTSPFAHYRNQYQMERWTLIGHWVWKLALLYFMPSFWWAVLHVMISEGLAGFGICIIVFFNHYAKEKVETLGDESFVELQFKTTRNLSPGYLTDWIAGGLNYQIEHHLFPQIPRNKLYAVSHRVKQFAKENGLDYDCCDFVPGVKMMLSHLSHVAQVFQNTRAKQL